MTELKEKIINIVEKYAKDNPQEIELMKEHMAKVRSNLKDSDLAVATNEGGNDTMAIERALFEIPETLLVLLLAGLTSEEQMAWKEKDTARWFAREFPLFRIPRNI